MIRERPSFQDRQPDARSKVQPSALKGLCRLLVVSVAMTFLFGCASNAGLIAEEREAIRSGKVALVLLRVICEVGGRPYECFGKVRLPGGPVYIIFGLGSFETAGEPRLIRKKFLSETSHVAGWSYFLLPPGSHYLAVMGSTGGDFREMPRWRIDVQDNSKLIYVGTLHLSGETIIKPSTPGSVKSLADETALARDVLSDHFENANEMTTNLMVRWRPGDPIIIRSPKPVPTN